MCCDFLLTSSLFQPVMAFHNIARQHREFQSQLDDVEKLWLYAHSVVSKHQALDASLAKANPSRSTGSRRLRSVGRELHGWRRRGMKPSRRPRWPEW